MLKNDSCLIPVEYPDTRIGRKTLRIMSKMRICDAVHLSAVVMAELVNRQGLNRELAIVELENSFYRIDVRMIDPDEVDGALAEGLELRRRREAGQ